MALAKMRCWNEGDASNTQVSEETVKWMKAYGQLVEAHRMALAKLSDAKIATRKWYMKALGLQKQHNHLLCQLQQAKSLGDYDVIPHIPDETTQPLPTSTVMSVIPIDEPEGHGTSSESPVRATNVATFAKIHEHMHNPKDKSQLSSAVSRDLQSRIGSRSFHLSGFSQHDLPYDAPILLQKNRPVEQPQSIEFSCCKGFDSKRPASLPISRTRPRGVGVGGKSGHPLANLPNIVEPNTDKSKRISTYIPNLNTTSQADWVCDCVNRTIMDNVYHKWLSSFNLISTPSSSWVVPESNPVQAGVGVNCISESLHGVLEDSSKPFERHDKQHDTSANGETIRLLLRTPPTDDIMKRHQTENPEASEAIYHSCEALNKSAVQPTIDNLRVLGGARSAVSTRKATSFRDQRSDHSDQSAILPWKDWSQASASAVGALNEAQRNLRGSLLRMTQAPDFSAVSKQRLETGSVGSDNSNHKRRLPMSINTSDVEPRSTKRKHGHRLQERHSTPPGLWETEMADTQELQRLRENTS